MPSGSCCGRHVGHCYGCGAPIWMEEAWPGQMAQGPRMRGRFGRGRRPPEDDREALKEQLDEIKGDLEEIEKRLRAVEG